MTFLRSSEAKINSTIAAIRQSGKSHARLRNTIFASLHQWSCGYDEGTAAIL